MLGDVLPAMAFVLVGLQAQKLLLIVPFVKRACFVEALVTLKTDQISMQNFAEHLRDLGLARASRALDQQWLFECESKEDRGFDAFIRDVTRAPEASADGFL